ncbi:MAG: GFA family protein, partial [Burkholderiaceae bacterium]
MLLEGSCHCRRVHFSLTSTHPVPFNRCYCSICRKTAGGGGYAINLGGEADTLQVTGREHVTVYRAMIEN